MATVERLDPINSNRVISIYCRKWYTVGPNKYVVGAGVFTFIMARAGDQTSSLTWEHIGLTMSSEMCLPRSFIHLQ